MKFRTRTTVVDAEQFRPPGPLPRGVVREVASDGDRHYVIDSFGCRIYLRPGDWVIAELHGGYRSCLPGVFAELYEPLPH